MPARKPVGLIRRHETPEQLRKRQEREEDMRPIRTLPMEAPARLKGHDVASAAWRRLMRMYVEMEKPIVSSLDLDLLLDYCLLTEQAYELDEMRKVAYQMWLELGEEHRKLVEEKERNEAVIMATKVIGAFDAIVKLDSRVDRKRALLLQLRQSLYLTPRARAGALPLQREKDEGKDPFEEFLDGMEEKMNGSDSGYEG